MTSTAILRRLPLPDSEPPYDDETSIGQRPRRIAVAATQGTLALAFSLPSGLSAVPALPRMLRLVPAPAAAPAETPGASSDVARLCDPRLWAGRLVQAMLEVLTGDRPVAQLLRWTSAETYADLARRAHTAGRVGAPPLREARALVRSVHVCQPDADVAEVTATVQSRGRTRAVALRLEGCDGRWQCTALQFV
ncbi:MAG TPA: Rv3235 family protein [Actinomycetes bacterium]|nr:Rv3235 family protein [Actinomycetes bacterium]